jgi:hypothetical protein
LRGKAVRSNSSTKDEGQKNIKLRGMTVSLRLGIDLHRRKRGGMGWEAGRTRLVEL